MSLAALRGFVSQWWAGIFGQARLSRVGEGASITDTLRIATPQGDQAIDCVRLESFGDVICPPVEAATIAWTKSEGGVCLSLGVANLRPADAKQGDRFLYCSKVGSTIKLRGANASNAGRLEIDAAEDVVVNGGTHAVAREGDGVWAGDLVLKVTSSGMTDTLAATFVTKDPEDPFYPFPPQQVLEFSLPSGSFAFPVAGGDEVTIHLTGVITRGANRFRA